MAAVDQMELDVGRTTPEALRIMPGDIGWVVFILAPGDMQDGPTDLSLIHISAGSHLP